MIEYFSWLFILEGYKINHQQIIKNKKFNIMTNKSKINEVEVYLLNKNYAIVGRDNRVFLLGNLGELNRKIKKCSNLSKRPLPELSLNTIDITIPGSVTGKYKQLFPGKSPSIFVLNHDASKVKTLVQNLNAVENAFSKVSKGKTYHQKKKSRRLEIVY